MNTNFCSSKFEVGLEHSVACGEMISAQVPISIEALDLRNFRNCAREEKRT